MKFGQIINGEITTWLSEQQIRAKYPDVCLPVDLIGCEYLLNEGWQVLEEGLQPTLDNTYQYSEQVAENIDGVWQLNWVVRDHDAETIASNEAAKIAGELKQLDRALVDYINQIARQYNYDDIAEVGVYASTDNGYQAEAQGIVQWSSNCWQLFYVLPAPMPVDAFMATLPVFSL